MANNHSISGTLHTIAWKLLDSIHQRVNHWRLQNLDFSILANDCIGGVITHNCGCRFNSPTVNLMFETEEQYICFLEHLEEYISLPVNYMRTEDVPRGGYPVGYLHHNIYGDVVLHFMHYKTFEEAVALWTKRCQRLQRDNIFAIFHFHEWDNTKASLLERFEKLPFRSKLIVSYANVLPTDFQWSESLFIHPGKLTYHHGILLEFYTHFRKRYIDDFDYVRWLNGHTVIVNPDTKQ